MLIRNTTYEIGDLCAAPVAIQILVRCALCPHVACTSILIEREQSWNHISHFLLYSMAGIGRGHHCMGVQTMHARRVHRDRCMRTSNMRRDCLEPCKVKYQLGLIAVPILTYEVASLFSKDEVGNHDRSGMPALHV